MIVRFLTRDSSKDQSKFLGSYLQHVAKNTQQKLYELRFSRGIVPTYAYLIARQALPLVVTNRRSGDVVVK